MKTIHKGVLLMLLGCSAAAYAADAGAAKEYNVDSGKLAIQGYDPVSYFSGHPAEGKKDITVVEGGITYRFASDENRKAFLAEPGKYKPAYGGWCATAMAQGKKVEIDPTNYKVTGGRLFLFYKSVFTNAINAWNKDESGSRVKADTAWKSISGE